jgi:integrase
VARPLKPALERREQSRGTLYIVRVSYAGQRIFVRLGGSWEGWTDERAERERELIGILLQRGEWTPPETVPTRPAPVRTAAPTFEQVANDLLAKRKRRGASENTLKDLRWRLETALGHFGPLAVDAIDVAVIEQFVDRALAERDAIEQAATTGRPLIERYVDQRTGRTNERRRRGLANSSINKVIAAVRAVLKEAWRQGHISDNPADDNELRVRERRPDRSFLQVDQVGALLEAAAALEREHHGLTWSDVERIRRSTDSAVSLARQLRVSDVLIGKVRRGELWTERRQRNRTDIPRLPVIATLVLAGLRIDELCGLRGEHLDFARGVVVVARDITKTDAGERTIPMLPALRELLLEHVMELRVTADQPVFATRTGRRNTTDNVRRIVVDQCRDTASARLVAIGRPPIRRCTPHSLRRTFASVLAEVGLPPRRAMYLLGHTDPKLTMGVYQQVLDMAGEAPAQLEQILGCDLDEAFTVLAGRAAHRICTSPERRRDTEPAADPDPLDAP